MTSPRTPSSARATMPADLTGDLELARRLADVADAVSMSMFDQPGLRVDTKADSSAVTEADLATERAIRAVLETERPGDGVFGEEYGTAGASNRQWIIDPIDGTANYLRGIPMWATLIALAIDGMPVVGVVSQPALARRWWAAQGLGAWTRTADGRTTPISVSTIATLAESSVSFQSIAQWEQAEQLPALLHLARSVWRDRGYGDAWPYMLLAEGRLECVAEFEVKEYDIAAHVPIVTEAGGTFTSMDGDSSLSARSALATNGRIHAAVLDLVQSADQRLETPQ